MRPCPTALLIIFLFLLQTAVSQEPQRLSDPQTVPAVWGVLEVPRSPGPHPGLVILHGSYGWRPVYAEIARALADSGFVALAIDYFAETGRDSLPQQRRQMLPHWQASIRGAIDYLGKQPFVISERIGLVGYSRGAFLAVSVASSRSQVKAVVDFFGGIDTSTQSFEEQLRNFPPLLILHGDSDMVVPIARDYQLRQALLDRRGDVEMHVYPGANHAFNGPFSPNYNESAATDSFRRTIEFLRNRLAKQ